LLKERVGFQAASQAVVIQASAIVKKEPGEHKRKKLCPFFSQAEDKKSNLKFSRKKNRSLIYLVS
jgi:hypothetical protein